MQSGTGFSSVSTTRESVMLTTLLSDSWRCGPKHVIKYDLCFKFPRIFAHNVHTWRKSNCRNFTDIPPLSCIFSGGGRFFVDTLYLQNYVRRDRQTDTLLGMKILCKISCKYLQTDGQRDCFAMKIPCKISRKSVHTDWHTDSFAMKTRWKFCSNTFSQLI